MTSLTKNVLSVFDYLVDNNLIRDAREFCRKIDIPFSSFSRIRSGEIEFPEDRVFKVMRAYHVNSFYLYHGTGKMFWITYTSMVATKEKKKLIIQNKFTSLENIVGDITLSLN
jgi:hypothetical protein